MRLRLLHRADIALLRCDALATSSNAGLVGNANPRFWRFMDRDNADGAIHRAAGPRLQEACDEVRAQDLGVRCPVGSAVATRAYGSLEASLVIHAVAPDGAYAGGLQRWWGRRQWSGSQGARAVYLTEAPPPGEADDLLAATYSSILSVANAHGVRSVGLPAIGCGVLGFHPERAAKLALQALAACLPEGGDSGSTASLERIDIALHSDAAYGAWSSAARKAMGPPPAIGSEAAVYDLRRHADATAY